MKFSNNFKNRDAYYVLTLKCRGGYPKLLKLMYIGVVFPTSYSCANILGLQYSMKYLGVREHGFRLLW